MLTIQLICIGKIKEKFFQDAIKEYSKRLSKYCKLSILELPDEKIPTKVYPSIVKEIKEKECSQILKHLKKDTYSICLDVSGKSYSSESFSKKIQDLSFETSNITFIIGGSLGLSKTILSNCNEKISFSQMTFPHQLIRIFLLEQLFRSFKIANGETYHK